MNYQQIKLVKDGNDHTLFYENQEKRIEQQISENDFKNIFENIEPNFGFSLPDKLIQDFVKDGSIIPSFKQSHQFTKEDFNEIINPFREELLYINELKNTKRQNIKNYIKNITKKRNRKSRYEENKKKLQEKKNKILSKIKRRNIQKNQDKEPKQKTNKMKEKKKKKKKN